MGSSGVGVISKSKWGTRQASPTLAGIRDDHFTRYYSAGRYAKETQSRKVVDAGCGTGYGSYLLADRFGLRVFAYEIDPDAIEFGADNYPHPHVTRHCAALADVEIPPVDMMVAFEILEHFEGAADFLERAAGRIQYLVGSVPNQDVVPYDAALHAPWHVRHYTPAETVELLESAGWSVLAIGSQAGKHGRAARMDFSRTDGRTIIFRAES